MIYLATIDTNVIVSSLLNEGSVPDQIVKMAINGPIVPLINGKIVEEYRRILSENKFSFKPDRVEKLLNDLSEKAIKLEPTPTDEHFEDLSDIIFYEITLTGRSTGDAYLITGNVKDFPKKHFVVKPREMLDIINKDKENNL